MADFTSQSSSGKPAIPHASEMNISTGGLFAPVTTPEKPRNQPFGRRRRNAQRGSTPSKETLPVLELGTPSPRTPTETSARVDENSPEPESKRPRLLFESSENALRRVSNGSTAAPSKLLFEAPSPVGSSRSSAIELSSDEEELSPGTTTAQTTPEASPPSRLTVQKSCKLGASRKLHGSTTASRPAIKIRAASDPTPLRNQALRPQDVDAEIASVLQEPSMLKDAQKETGCVYVAPVLHKGRRLIKIGFTAETSVRKRLKSIQTVCKEMDFIPLSGKNPDQSWVPTHYRRVERLAHAELSNFVYDCDCACRTKHKEYFAIDEKVAFGVVDRWARFVRRVPYVPESGALTEEWRFRLGRFREMKFGRSGRLEVGNEHLRRHLRWDAFVCADRWDWHRHRTARAFQSAWPYRWAACSFIQGVYLAVANSSVWTLGIVVLMVVGLALETVPDLASDLASLVLGYEVVPPRMDAGHEFRSDEGSEDESDDEEEDEQEEGGEGESETRQTLAVPGAWADSQVDPARNETAEESGVAPASSRQQLRFGNKVIDLSSDEEDGD